MILRKNFIVRQPLKNTFKSDFPQTYYVKCKTKRKIKNQKKL